MATIVETAPISQPSPIASITVFLVKYGLYIGMAFLGLIVVATIFLLIRRMKKRINPFIDEYKKVKALCKFQRDVTIKEVYMISDKGMKHLGHYLGEAITQDGYKNILFWKGKKWYLFWFPARLDFFDVVKETMIIRANVNNEFTYKEMDKDTKVESEKTVKLATDLITKSEDKILIRGYGIERVKFFLYPVLKDVKGNIADRKIEIFERERSTALVSSLYQQAEDFANISRELININPSVRYVNKTGQPVVAESTEQRK